jgi:hypothetical protein
MNSILIIAGSGFDLCKCIKLALIYSRTIIISRFLNGLDSSEKE